MTIVIGAILPSTSTDVALGTTFLAASGRGIDLACFDYVEEERFVTGTACQWLYDDSLAAVPLTSNVPFVTRMLIRRPANSRNASGLVLLEPLHPNADTAMTWQNVHDWALRNGHTWIGVTQDRVMSNLLRDTFPQRYCSLSIPVDGLGYDILGDVAVAVRSGAVPGVAGERLILSGWSATGSFCRVYLQDGFHDRHRLDDGTEAVDGIAICISSGAAGQAGYPTLSPQSRLLPDGEPRRTIRGGTTPVVEILSECESETHYASMRPDSDGPHDRYRLYQVAGTSHTTGSDDVLTNAEQLRNAGFDLPAHRIKEGRTDSRMDLIAHSLFEALYRWITDDQPPTGAGRFEFAGEQGAPGDAVELVRDRYGNVEGGIRTPWVEAPLARYAPHSTPESGSCHAPSWTPLATPELVSWLIGNRAPFSDDTVRQLYPSLKDFLDRYDASVRDCVSKGFLLVHDAEILREEATNMWPL